MIQRILAALTIAATTAAIATSPAQAFPDAAAKIESATRPNFGLLLRPPVRHHYRGGDSGWWDERYHGPYREEITVWCDGWRNDHEVQRALNRVRTGGTLIIKTHSRTCDESLHVTRSVNIVGEVSHDAFNWDRNGGMAPRVVLNAPRGRPCIYISNNARVSIRGLVINAPAAGEAACIRAQDAEVDVRDTVIRYDGEAPAVLAEGGSLTLDSMGVAARTRAPAIEARRSRANLSNLRVATTDQGVVIEPGYGDNTVDRVFVRALDGGWNGDAEGRSAGLVVRDGAGRGVQVTDSVFIGFATGVRFDQGSVGRVMYGLIARSRLGVVTNGDVRVQEAQIGASDIGVYVHGGQAAVFGNNIFGVRVAAIFADPGAMVWADGNSVYPYGDGCGFMDDRNYNTSGQACRPSRDLPGWLRRDGDDDARWADGWSEWRYNWGYDGRHDRGYDDGRWRDRRPDYRSGYGWQGGTLPQYTDPSNGTWRAPQSPSTSNDPYGSR